MNKRNLQPKRALCSVLLVLLLNVVGWGKVYAQSFTVGDLNYSVNSDGVSVTVTGHVDGQNAVGELVIPEAVTYGGTSYPVTTIGGGAFGDCFGLTGDLVIPNSVTTIGDSAFAGCIGLTGVLVIPNSVTTIGDAAFNSCGFTGDLVIPNSLTMIDHDVFNSCSSFTGSLTIPNSVTSIGDWAFYGCSGFTEIHYNATNCVDVSSDVTPFIGCGGTLIIGNNVERIPAYMFKDAAFIGSLTIPNSVVSIGSGAFEGCSFDGLNIDMTNIPADEMLTIGGEFTGTLTLGSSVTTIGDGAFFACGFTGSLTIPNSVISIGVAAFSECRGFTGSLIIPNSVTTLGAAAFAFYDEEFNGFTGDLVIPNSLTTIEDDTFYGCSGFTGSLTIPNSVTSIGRYAFDGCSGFTGSLTIPNSVTTIGDNAFWGCSFNGLNIDMTHIPDCPYEGENVFGWSFTGTLTLGNSVTSIGHRAFEGFGGFMGNLVIPNSVTTIGYCAFSGCSGFTGSVTIGNSVTSIGSSAFSGGSGFTGSLTIGNSVATIGDRAFSGCSGFTGSLTIPNSVTTIGDYAFDGCSGLTSFSIPVSVTSIGDGAFDGTGWYNNQPAGVLYIDGCCIGYKEPSEPITDLQIVDGTRLIADFAFWGCSGFTGSLTIGNSVTSIGDYAFYGCSGFTGNLTLPNSLTTIGWAAFEFCSGFTGSLTIPNSVTTIRPDAFGNCSGFTGSLVIPNSVTTIGYSAFYGCSGFTGSLTIGNSVATIGNYAFYGCSGLTSITSFAETPPTGSAYGNYTFGNINHSIPVYVPCGVSNAYQNAEGWSEFTNYFEMCPDFFITVAASPTEGGTVTGGGYYDVGETCTLTATANPGYYFQNWTENGEVVSTEATYSFTVTGERTLVANFSEITNHWTARNFRNYKVVKGIILIDGVEQFSHTLEVSAFCGEECRASICAMPFPITNQYVVNMTIGTDLDAGGELISFRIYDHAIQEELDVQCTCPLLMDNFDPVGTINNWYQFTFSHEVSVTATVVPEGAGTVSGQGDYLPGAEATLEAVPAEGYVFRDWRIGNEVVSSVNPYTFTVAGATHLTAMFDRQQSQPLSEGWNWWSTYIEQDGIDGLAMLENSLGHNGVLIMGQGQNVENYYSYVGYDYWWGDLSCLQNEKGYKVMVSAACNAVMTGTAAVPENHPVTIQPNWNWIGYPCTTVQSIESVAFQPADGDLIVKQGANSTYYYGYGWWPSFSLEPGKSYQYFSMDTEPKSMTFTNGRSEGEQVSKDGETHWTARNFKNYKVVKGIILIDGVEQFSSMLEVGAFCGEECRASNLAALFPITNQYVVNLTIGTDLDSGSELITFRIYDHATQQELDVECVNTLTLDNFDPVGTINNWFQYAFVSTSTGYHFTTAGNWGTASNWSGGELPGTGDEVFIDAACQLDQNAEVTNLTVSDGQSLNLQSGKTLTVSGTLANAATTGLVIEDGAQLVNASGNVAATVEKDITAYGNTNTTEGWYTIASPVDAMPIEGSAFLTPDYDLYRYNENPQDGLEWENYKENLADFTAFENGRGYLYANSNTFSPAFVGTLNNAAVTYSLSYTDRPNDDMDGFNLIGNPFPHVIYKGNGGAIDNANLASGFYTLTNEGAWHVNTYADAIQPGQGILVKTVAALDLTIAKTNAAATAESGGAKAQTACLDINITSNAGTERAVAYFREGIGLDKMGNLAEDAPMLCIRQNGKDYAIAHFSQEAETMDLRFKNTQAGMFTIAVSATDTNFSYLHLIDNITGADIDLLSQPVYTFQATGGEYDARFMLVFKVETGIEENTQESFCFAKDGILYLNTETENATLTLTDVLGRIVKSTEPNSNRIDISDLKAGIYVVKLGGRTQKVVVR